MKERNYKWLLEVVIIAQLILIAAWTSNLNILAEDILDTQNLQQQQLEYIQTKTTNLEAITAKDVASETTGDMEFIGEFTITYYCGCEKCCGKTDKITKLGTTAESGRTVGTDWNIISPTTKIYIDGIGERVVEDTGGGLQGNQIDVYVDNHDVALNLGRHVKKVYAIR